VVSSATRAVRRSSSAFVATVVPCTRRSVISSTSRSVRCSSAARLASPSSTPSDWSAGVVAALASTVAPSAPMQTTSVKVPPTSTPMR
jgi:hypothetical protein